MPCYIFMQPLPREAADIRPVSELADETGDVENGRQVYEQITHFGPELSVIAYKLPEDALYNSIIEPNTGVVVGFESYILTLDDNSRVSGIISSKTAEKVVLRLPGGFANSF